jgi:hypothetical protein
MKVAASPLAPRTVDAECGEQNQRKSCCKRNERGIDTALRNIFKSHLRRRQRPKDDERHIEQARNQALQPRYRSSLLGKIRRIHSYPRVGLSRQTFLSSCSTCIRFNSSCVSSFNHHALRGSNIAPAREEACNANPLDFTHPARNQATGWS